MKRRRRPCPTIFSPSDSDSDSAPSASRFAPRPPSAKRETGTATAAATATTGSVQPDSLDTFMSTLHTSGAVGMVSGAKKSVIRPTRPMGRTCPSSPSSEDEPSVLSTPVGASSLSAGAEAEAEAEAEVEVEKEVGGNNRDERRTDTPTEADHQKQQYALPPVDYAKQPGPVVNRLTFTSGTHLETDPEAIKKQTSAMRASVRGGHAPILSSFHDTCPPVPEELADRLSSTFPAPTPIQALTFPYALAGRDIVAIAQTGSGKTVAYALPMLAHAAVQSGTSRSGHGPVGLVLVPTRDLATQIAEVLNEYGRSVGVSACCVVGGVGKYEQFKQIRDSGAGVIVSTPGRLIDMLRMRACRMRRCSFVVLDEADRMLDLGFGPQVRALLTQIRPDAQLTLFSATMPKFVERLIHDFLKDPVHISFTGSVHRHTAMVTDNVTDCFLRFDHDPPRKRWLIDHLPKLVDDGLLIIFCATRGDSAALANTIRGTGMPAACVHGETDQSDREALIRMFRANELPILVTTDVAARGLDIANVQNVVNYGCAKSWEWHVHRVGRCGRASEKGSAFTLMDSSNSSDQSFANEACYILRREKRPIPEALTHLQDLCRKAKEGQKRNRSKRSRGWE